MKKYLTLIALGFSLTTAVVAIAADDEMDILSKYAAGQDRPVVRAEHKGGFLTLTTVKEPVAANAPVKKPTVSIAAYGKRLGDVVFDLCSGTGYSVVFGPQVDPNSPVVVDLKDVTIDKAMNAITNYVNYGYEVAGNTVTINRLMNKRFMIPEASVSVPTMVQELGGDMIGNSGSSSSGSGSGGSGGSSSGGADQNLKASVTLSKAADKMDGKKVFEDNIKRLLSPDGHYVLDWLSYSLLVSDSPRNIKLIDEFMKNLNDTVGQVLKVEATITQVTTSNTLDYGIDWTLLAKKLGGTTLSGGGDSTTVAASLTNIPTPSFTITRAASDMSAVLKALQQQGTIKVLQKPLIFTRNLQPTAIFDGTTNPYISSIQQAVTGVSGTTTTSYNVSTAQDGIMLAVKCQIMDDDYIDVQIAPILATIQSWTTFNIGGNSFQNPVSSVQQTLQSVTIKDGETIIIGGIKQNRKEVDETSVPLLSSIPLIGALFKGKNDTSSSAELVIALKVSKVVKGGAAAQGKFVALEGGKF